MATTIGTRSIQEAQRLGHFLLVEGSDRGLRVPIQAGKAIANSQQRCLVEYVGQLDRLSGGGLLAQFELKGRTEVLLAGNEGEELSETVCVGVSILSLVLAPVLIREQIANTRNDVSRHRGILRAAEALGSLAQDRDVRRELPPLCLL